MAGGESVSASGKKKAPDFSGAFFNTDQNLLLDPGHVSSLQAFRAFDYVERYPIAFNKGFEPVAGDGGEMAKYVFAAFLLKKTKTLAVVKPFYSTVYHVVYLLLIFLALFCQRMPLNFLYINSLIRTKQVIFSLQKIIPPDPVYCHGVKRQRADHRSRYPRLTPSLIACGRRILEFQIIDGTSQGRYQ